MKTKFFCITIHILIRSDLAFSHIETEVAVSRFYQEPHYVTFLVIIDNRKAEDILMEVYAKRVG